MQTRTLNQSEIEIYLPHRPPMLMLSRVTDYGDTWIKTETDLSGEEFFFQGHFPGKPIMPGVMISETIAQAGALIPLLNNHFDGAKFLMTFAGIDNAKYKKPVQPGQTLCTNVEIVKHRKTLYKFTGDAFVDGILVSRLSFSAALMPRTA